MKKIILVVAVSVLAVSCSAKKENKRSAPAPLTFVDKTSGQMYANQTDCQLAAQGECVPVPCEKDCIPEVTLPPVIITTPGSKDDCDKDYDKDCIPVVTQDPSQSTDCNDPSQQDCTPVVTGSNNAILNRCLNAFSAKGIYLPAGAMQRTVNAGLAFQDVQTSNTPMLNIVLLGSTSTSTLQLLNPIGFYCLAKSPAVSMTVTVQRKCSAKLVAVDTSAMQYNSNSTLTELPCLN